MILLELENQKNLLIKNKKRRIKTLIKIDLNILVENNNIFIEVPIKSFGTIIGDIRYKIRPSSQFVVTSSNISNLYGNVVALQENVENTINRVEHFMLVIIDIIYNDPESSEFYQTVAKLRDSYKK